MAGHTGRQTAQTCQVSSSRWYAAAERAILRTAASRACKKVSSTSPPPPPRKPLMSCLRRTISSFRALLWVRATLRDVVNVPLSACNFWLSCRPRQSQHARLHKSNSRRENEKRKTGTARIQPRSACDVVLRVCAARCGHLLRAFKEQLQPGLLHSLGLSIRLLFCARALPPSARHGHFAVGPVLHAVSTSVCVRKGICCMHGWRDVLTLIFRRATSSCWPCLAPRACRGRTCRHIEPRDGQRTVTQCALLLGPRVTSTHA